MSNISLNDPSNWPPLHSNLKHKNNSIIKSCMDNANNFVTENEEVCENNLVKHSTTGNIEELSLNSKCLDIDNLTREDILQQRIIRRKEKKVQQSLKKIEDKRLKIIDTNKSKKLLIIPHKELENLHNISNEDTCCSFIAVNNANNDYNYIKNSKGKDLIQFDFNLYTTKERLAKPKVNEIPKATRFDTSKPSISKGKKYENKTKPLTKLKKNIVKCRNEKKKLQNCDIEIKADNVQDTQDDVQLNITLEDMSINEEYIAQNKDSENINTSLYHSENKLTFIELKSSLKILLGSLCSFQDRAYKKNPMRANMRRRYVVGFHEVLKSIKLKNVFLVIIASDIEKKGCEDIVNEIQCIASESDIPLIFALRRREIGYLTYKKVGVSCVAILNKEGAEEAFNRCLDYYNKFMKAGGKGPLLKEENR